MASTKFAQVRIWDLPTRLFHWLLVLLIICAWVSFEFSEVVGDGELLWHRMNGYAILILVIWRLLWGLVGSPASRFANFISWPWSAARYGLDLVRGRDRHFLGHNPLGAYMIIALLALVGLQGVLGLYSTEHNSVTWGPLGVVVSDKLSATLTKWHVWMFENVLIIFIAAHIAANVLYRIVKKDRLIEAMVTGSKPAGDYEDVQLQITANAAGVWFRAVICLAAAIMIFAGAIVAMGGKLFY
jgi:cytochrome b